MDRFFSRLPSLEVLLWVLASLAAFAAFLVLVPVFFSPSAAQRTSTPRPTITAKPSATPVLPPPPPRAQTLAPLPTPDAGAEAFDFPLVPQMSGWLMSGEKQPHWGDRNLHAGARREHTYQSLLYFDLTALAPGSRILFAAIEITGVNRSNLGAIGEWRLRLLPSDLLTDWRGRENTAFQDAVTLGEIGAALTPADLDERQINQFVFAPNQLKWLEDAVNDSGQIAFRLDGPSGANDSLFTWEGGDPGTSATGRPLLRLVAVQGQFVWITQTPTPQNVITAAAMAAQATDDAQRYGTSTPLPRRYATTAHDLVVTPVPTPANLETATARAAYATAVAFTTGTFTPTPKHLVTATPTAPFAALSQITPRPTSTPTISRARAFQTPIPPESGLLGKIIFYTDREPGIPPQIWVMSPNGAVIGKTTGEMYYRLAETHELFSPDGRRQVDVTRGQRLVWNIVIVEVATGALTPLFPEAQRGPVGAFHPAWSPQGDKIAYASDRSGATEIYVYDLRTQTSTRLTLTVPNIHTGVLAYNKHPSWSPDGKQIVFSSDRDTDPARRQIWIMNADGSNLRPLSPSPYNDWDPIWVK